MTPLFCSSFRHPNIVRLLGFSDMGGHAKDVCLVYEIGVRGSLSSNLLDNEKAREIDWKQRIRISFDMCRAINYLHGQKEGEKVFHRDVKSDNIVLTATLSPKLIDCGLAKYLTDKPKPAGTVRPVSLPKHVIYGLDLTLLLCFLTGTLLSRTPSWNPRVHVPAVLPRRHRI